MPEEQISPMEETKPTPRKLDVGACYSQGWDRLWQYFWSLLLIFFVNALLTLPEEIPVVGIFYTILIGWPLAYGFFFVMLKTARGEKPIVADLFRAFGNYGSTLLAFFLVVIIVIGGVILLIVPGIIFACRLAFVPYLVTDRKMGAVEAISTSWRLTQGHAWTVFLIYLAAIPIALLGLICLVVGVIPASLWIGLAHASLYYAVTGHSGGVDDDTRYAETLIQEKPEVEPDTRPDGLRPGDDTGLKPE